MWGGKTGYCLTGTEFQCRKVKTSGDGLMVRVANNVNILSAPELYS